MDDHDFRQRLRATFQTEAAEQVQALAGFALTLERATSLDEHLAAVEQLFRGTHTLKGAARMVNESDVETLSHTLEQQLSGLKSAQQRVPSSVATQIVEQITEISRLLGISLAPISLPPRAPEAPVEPAPSAPPSPPVPSSSVRVAGERLDALLLHAEEMAGAKIVGDRQVQGLRALNTQHEFWQRSIRRIHPDVTALKRFLDSSAGSVMAKELKALVQHVDAIHEQVRTWDQELATLASHAAAEQRRLGTMIDHLLAETKEILMQPFSSLLETFPAFIREIAQQQGKEADFEIQGAEVEVDRRVLEEIKGALIHLIRNSVDHGLETRETRLRSGKPTRGRLELSVQNRSGGSVEVTLSDDGKGIDPTEITALARQLRLIPAEGPDLSDREAFDLLFRSGFTTRAAVNALSGRGLGLAIVREKAEQIGGSASVESRKGLGTTFRLEVPVTLARFRGLFIRVQSERFVLPSTYVRRVLRLEERALRPAKNQTLIEIDGEPIVLLDLSSLLQLRARTGSSALPSRSSQVFAVLLESGRSRVALRVEEAPYEEEVVMKNLGPMLRGARWYVGATLMVDGKIVPVLNITTLLSAAAPGGRNHRTLSASPQKIEKRKRRVLIAEDSITSRSLLKNILQSAGFEVRTAVDGADALTTLKHEPVDLVVSDVQMPQMDGFELTSKIRADPALSTLPVILITSLAGREDRARGVDAGANAYLVKSSFDQSDLLEAIGRLLS